MLFFSLTLCFCLFAVATAKFESFLIIDAGSSGSRIHIFNVQRTPQIEIIHVNELKERPGLSSFASDPTEAGHSLQPLIDFAEDHVLGDKAKIPIHLQATAGLRLVSPAACQEILSDVRRTLHNSPFLFKDEWALVISGKEEGLNGWLAANYLAKNFNADVITSSVGIIELGGASLQMAFLISDPRDVDTDCERNHVLPFVFNNRTYSIYTHSFLGYGLQAAQKGFQRVQMDAIENDGNPCYPTHFKHSSAGDYDRCVKLMESLLSKSEKCECPPCSFKGVHQPPIRATLHFLAIENFYYTSQFFDWSKDLEFLDELEKYGREYCNMPWEEVESKFPKERTEKLSQYCFSAAYINSLIRKGFSLPHPADSVKVTKKIADVGIDWVVGAVFKELTGNNRMRPIEGANVWLTSASHDPNPDVPIRIDKERDISESLVSLFKLILPLSIVFGIYTFCTQDEENKPTPKFPLSPRQSNGGPSIAADKIV